MSAGIFVVDRPEGLYLAAPGDPAREQLEPYYTAEDDPIEVRVDVAGAYSMGDVRALAAGDCVRVVVEVRALAGAHACREVLQACADAAHAPALALDVPYGDLGEFHRLTSRECHDGEEIVEFDAPLPLAWLELGDALAAGAGPGAAAPAAARAQVAGAAAAVAELLTFHTPQRFAASADARVVPALAAAAAAAGVAEVELVVWEGAARRAWAGALLRGGFARLTLAATGAPPFELPAAPRYRLALGDARWDVRYDGDTYTLVHENDTCAGAPAGVPEYILAEEPVLVAEQVEAADE